MKNLNDAYVRSSAPQILMRKNIGMRPSSQKINQWKKFNAVKTPNIPVSSNKNRKKKSLGSRSCFQDANIASGETIAVKSSIVMLKPSTPSRYLTLRIGIQLNCSGKLMPAAGSNRNHTTNVNTSE